MQPNNAQLNFAIDAVRQASLLVRTIQAETVTPALTKGDHSPVTLADYASQAVVAAHLAEAFPGDLLVAEEDAAALRLPENAGMLAQVTGYVSRLLPALSTDQLCTWVDRGASQPAARFWTLDPIDGTKGFLRGDQYAIALALIEDGQVQVGVLGCPNLSNGYILDLNGPGSLILAARGQGAWIIPLDGDGSPVQLSVSAISDPAEARILRSFESGHTNVSQIDEFAAALEVKVPPLRMDSQAKYAVQAAGQGELCLRLLSAEQPHYREKIWDQAAGALILEESGGQITDLDGRSLDFTTGRTLANNRGILASNRWLHPMALDALRRVAA